MALETITPRQRKFIRWGQLKTERATWDKRWRDISEYLLPFSGRFFAQDRNRGDKAFNSIIDSTATRALRILSAGMMAGMTSPARPWFRLATPDAELMEFTPVKLWLNDVTELMRDIFYKSNTYRTLHTLYEELGAFATAANIIVDDFDSVIWNHPLTVGEYAIACDPKGRVNTIYREFEMTVAQLVEEFVYDGNPGNPPDWSRVSSQVKNMWDTMKALDHWVPVLHAIEPRMYHEREYGKSDAKNMPWASCYYEVNSNESKALRESGFRDFPVLAPRWHTRGRDIYGNGPAFEALGDVKQLQHEQLRKGQGIDYQSFPSVALPGEMKGREVDTLPGGVTYLGLSGDARVQKVMDGSGMNISHLLADIQDVRQRIYQAFYADLFLLISNDQRRMPVTAREIAERHEEKLLMLGPVLERLHDEMLSPLIDITFVKMLRAGILPPPPPEMQGMELKVEFVSMLAQAQRMVGLSSVDRLIGTVALISQAKQDPGVWDKIDTDEVIDKYADMLAIDPSLIVGDEKIALIRESRQQQQAAMQTAAMARPMADMAAAAKTASEVDADKLAEVTEQFSSL